MAMHGSLVTVATCNLNQWAMDFDGNVERILKSCQQAKALGASYRLGPELEICGYGCEDHFFEHDTILHCWESLHEVMQRGATDGGLLCDFGMPVLFQGVRYNCRILVHNRTILMIRPKTAMADGGNYRESRYFTAYPPTKCLKERILLPQIFHDSFGQREAPFGLQPIQCADGTTVGCESCEELWTPQSSHIGLALRGVDIIGNASGSHHELRKLDARIDLIKSATQKSGGIYLYANQRGCDGGRLYYDGCAMICVNGKVLVQAPQFNVSDVQVIVATVDLDEVRSYRASIPSLGMQARFYEGNYSTYHDITLIDSNAQLKPTKPLTKLQYHSPEEECCLGPACWLWDYLRRSGATGFFLPLSGGADSSSVAAIVGVMCQLVTNAAKYDPDVAQDCRRVCHKDGDWIPKTPEEMANCVFYTTFMGTENSSRATESRAARLGTAIGSYHLSIKIDLMVSAIIKVFSITTGKTPRFTSHGGTVAEDLALQNIQARLRMVTAYLLAQLLPWVRGRSGFLLVLGSANVDEGLRGYMTKYDCSSADLNPIGAMSKGDLKRMLLWASQNYENYQVLAEIANAAPTAELRPIVSTSNDGEVTGDEHSQLDEVEMGMTYEELGIFGRLRKIGRCGPVAMFRQLCVEWSHLSPQSVAEKVKRFFYYYSINRHKMCTITPAYHAEAYSPDDNRFDLRQFLYNVTWSRQFRVIDELATKAKEE